MEGESGESKEKNILDELAHSQTVRKLIECPVCLELPLPPIYVCTKGHIVCNNCQARTYACPLCREHYSTTRGFVAEGIIEKCILRCKFADQGCPLTMRGSALRDHLDACDYRAVKCVDCGGKMIDYDQYEDHLLKYHSINGITQSRAYVIYSMNLEHQIAFGEKCCWPQYYLKAFGETFLLRLYATHWFVCAWISLLGPKSKCSKYEALLEFHPTHDDTVVHTWQGPVNHFRDEQAKQIFLQGRGLITPMETLMQIAHVAQDHAEWLYNIEILQGNSEGEKDKAENGEAVDAGADEIDQESAEIDATNLAGAQLEELPLANDISISTTQQQIPQRPILRMATPSASAHIPQRITPLSFPSLRTPPATASSLSGIRSSRNAVGSHPQTPNLSAGPATLSSSTTVLSATAAATIAPVLPHASSVPEMSQNSVGTTCLFPTINGTSQGSMTVSTARHNARLLNNLRRNSLFCTYLTGGNRRFGLTEEDWNCSTESEEE